MVCDVEYFVECNVNEEDREKVRGQCVNIITNHQNKLKNSVHKIKNDKELKLFNKTAKFLKSNPQIIVTKTDKTNQTIAMNKTEYITKTKELLADTDTYRKVGSNPTHKLKNLTNTLVRKLHKQKYIDLYTKNKLCKTSPTAPKLYSLVKNHKDDNPVRPIVSFVNSPTYELSKFLTDIISPIQTNKYDVKDSFDFFEKITKIILPANYKLISLDVSSLFTNVSISAVTDLISSQFHKIQHHTKIPKAEFLEALKLCTEEGYLQFENSFYKMKYGCPMGSPIAPLLSNLYLDSILDKILPKLPFQVPFLFKFVDDIITAIPNDQEDTILHHFNQVHPRIKFTIESEKSDGTIPFLDLELIRKPNGSIDTKWWQKPLNSGRYINFRSHSPYYQKINFVKNLINRALKLTSVAYHREITNKIVDLLLINGYPHRLICKLLKSPTSSNPPTPVPTSSTSHSNHEPKIYFGFPYIEELSVKLKKTLNKYKKPQSQITFRNSNTLNKLFTKTKDKDPKELQSNFIYRIPCQSDCGMAYYGQSKQYFKNRIYQNKYSCETIINNPEKPDSTALATHFRNTNHKIQFEKTKILCFSPNPHKLNMKEMIHIERNKHDSLNKRTDVQDLSKCYSNIITNHPPSS